MDILFLIVTPPGPHIGSREVLDPALAAAADDHRVTLVFAGDGIEWLLEATPLSHAPPPAGRLVKLASICGIEHMYCLDQAPTGYEGIAHIGSGELSRIMGRADLVEIR